VCLNSTQWAALIRQDFIGPAEAAEPLEESLGYQLRLLMAGHRPRHDEAAVVVQKNRQVNTTGIARQMEARDVRLTQLTSLRALESAGRLLLRFPARLWRWMRLDPRVVQRSFHRAQAYPRAREACHKITHAAMRLCVL
jgi:hypothetical protein